MIVYFVPFISKENFTLTFEITFASQLWLKNMKWKCSCLQLLTRWHNSSQCNPTDVSWSWKLFTIGPHTLQLFYYMINAQTHIYISSSSSSSSSQRSLWTWYYWGFSWLAMALNKLRAIKHSSWMQILRRNPAFWRLNPSSENGLTWEFEM